MGLTTRAEFSSALGVAYDDKKKEELACTYGGITTRRVSGFEPNKSNTPKVDHQADALSYALATNPKSSLTVESANTNLCSNSVFDQNNGWIINNVSVNQVEEGVQATAYIPTTTKMPKFKQYSTKWPLGIPGNFYNSIGDHRKITDMKTSYIKSTMKWLEKSFDFELAEHDFAYDKFVELGDEIDRRESEEAGQYRMSKQQEQARNRSKINKNN